MKGINTRHILGLAAVVCLQIFVFQNSHLRIGAISSLVIFVYPITLITLPLTVQRNTVLIIGFAIGLLIDIWYQTPGIHTSALVLMLFVRPYCLQYILDERELRINMTTEKFTLTVPTFLTYGSILYIVHSTCYFILDQFGLMKPGILVLRVLLSALLSLLFALVYRLIFLSR